MKNNQRNIQKNIDIKETYLRELHGFVNEDYLLAKMITDHDSVYKFKQERPDIIIRNDKHKIIIGIEIFEVNCSSQMGRGTISNHESGKLKRKHYTKEIEYLKGVSEDMIETKGTYNVNTSIENLVRNFIYSFENHRLKIDDYLKELELHNEGNFTSKIGFQILDTSPLGLFSKKDATSNEDIKKISIFEILEIIEHITSCNNIDFIIFSSEYDGISYLISQENIDKFSEIIELQSISNIELINTNINEYYSTIKV